MSANSESENKTPKKWYQSAWLKRLGWGGFLFFFIKGLLWLAAFFGLFKWLGD